MEIVAYHNAHYSAFGEFTGLTRSVLTMCNNRTMTTKNKTWVQMALMGLCFQRHNLTRLHRSRGGVQGGGEGGGGGGGAVERGGPAPRLEGHGWLHRCPCRPGQL